MRNLKPDDTELTDEEEAQLQAQIAADPDDPAHWRTQGTRSRPAREVVPEIVEAYEQGRLHVLGPSPGATLKGVLASRGMSQRKLAAAMGRPANLVTDIVRGKKAITAQTALDLEEALGLPAQYWLHMEADYRLAKERVRRSQ